jgi:Holliday junction resolvase RusA-like endonuclease
MNFRNSTNYGLWINGHPQPKERPKFSNGRAYTPPATRAYEKLIAEEWAKIYPGVLLDEPMTIHVDVYSKTADRADVDNYLKIALDGLQGAAFVNDNKVRTVKATKSKVTDTADEGMRILIYLGVLF